jgi:GH15 family glucan-1,4-alpha-glucosidase
MSVYPPIEDHAAIGDCRTAALIAKDGTLDWLCLPRFDSPAVFAALLDADRGGSFVVRPAGSFTVGRRYLDATNVLETTFRTESGVLRLTDVMAVAPMAERRRELRAEHEVLRRVECVDGEVEVEVRCDPRPDFGRGAVRLRDRRALGFCFEFGAQVLVLRSELPLSPAADGRGVTGGERLVRGERRFLSLGCQRGEPAAVLPLGEAAAARLARSRRWWEEWAARLRYEGPFPAAVVRSVLALKLLSFAPSGAVIAAPTTSLPEVIGGSRNWDYRYCWLRDASWTLTALFEVGRSEEGAAFLSWLLQATRLQRPELRVLYDVHGEAHLAERALPELEGYAGSRPVRVGNDAFGQLQLDVYGEVIEGANDFVERGGRLDRAQGRLLAGLGKTVLRRWREPDEGIWEQRRGRFQHTFSKVMCWVALDRLLRLEREGHVRVDVARLARERDEIRRAVEAHGWSGALGSYVDVFDGDGADASLLLFGIYDYLDPRSPRMRSTFDRIDGELSAGPLLYRYAPGRDGLPGTEAPFGICSFWAVEALARMGRVAAAEARCERLLAYANDVGLYGEQIDPATGAARGNFPQAFSHVGLINAALTLAECTGRPVEPRPAARVGAGAEGVLSPR